MDLRMTKHEREAFLAGLHVGVICVAESGRGPLAAPIWYDYRPERGVWIVTEPTSRKGKALDAAGRFSLVAQNEDMPYRYVSVEGPIVEARPADREHETRAMAHRYFGEELGNAYIDSQTGDASFLYAMQPERWLTVDYGKMTGG